MGLGRERFSFNTPLFILSAWAVEWQLYCFTTILLNNAPPTMTSVLVLSSLEGYLLLIGK